MPRKRGKFETIVLTRDPIMNKNAIKFFYGNMLFTNRSIFLFFITFDLRSLRSLEVLLFVKRWPLPQGLYLIFPFFVSLNLFATPFFVLSFGIAFYSV
jgi:hypothetical protein